jgi:hypothetical protein
VTSNADQRKHPTEQLAHGGGDPDVEARHGLVEQQHVGVGGQGAGERDPLGLAARELTWHAIS